MKKFIRFLVRPDGIVILLQIGISLSLVFLLAQVRNASTQFASYNDCSALPNTFDWFALGFDGLISLVCITSLCLLGTMLMREYRKVSL